MHAQGIDEKDQAELARELQDPFISMHFEVAEKKSGKQDARDTQLDPGKAHIAKGKAQHNDHCEYQNGQGRGRGRNQCVQKVHKALQVVSS